MILSYNSDRYTETVVEQKLVSTDCLCPQTVSADCNTAIPRIKKKLVACLRAAGSGVSSSSGSLQLICRSTGKGRLGITRVQNMYSKLSVTLLWAS